MTTSTMRIIAEAGVNHNGDMDLARGLIDAAKSVGADTVKFQLFDPDALAAADAPLAAYQRAAAGGDQRDLLRGLAFGGTEMAALKHYAEQQGISFLLSAFDERSLRTVAAMGLPEVKIASGEVTNGPLLLLAAQLRLNVILSTGMASMDEVELALAVLHFGYSHDDQRIPSSMEEVRTHWRQTRTAAPLAERVKLMHCVSSYPAPVDQLNLLAIPAMMKNFDLECGYSDHALEDFPAILALGLGARLFEKHLTLDTTLPGPDHKASLDPAQFKDYVTVLKASLSSLGDGIKRPAPCEADVAHVARKGIRMARPVAAGAVLRSEDLAVQRPQLGRSPMQFWDLVGRVAKKPLAVGQMLDGDE